LQPAAQSTIQNITWPSGGAYGTIVPYTGGRVLASVFNQETVSVVNPDGYTSFQGILPRDYSGEPSVGQVISNQLGQILLTGSGLAGVYNITGAKLCSLNSQGSTISPAQAQQGNGFLGLIQAEQGYSEICNYSIANLSTSNCVYSNAGFGSVISPCGLQPFYYNSNANLLAGISSNQNGLIIEYYTINPFAQLNTTIAEPHLAYGYSQVGDNVVVGGDMSNNGMVAFVFIDTG
jgi:hypothetical protein